MGNWNIFLARFEGACLTEKLVFNTADDTMLSNMKRETRCRMLTPSNKHCNCSHLSPATTRQMLTAEDTGDCVDADEPSSEQNFAPDTEQQDWAGRETAVRVRWGMEGELKYYYHCTWPVIITRVIAISRQPRALH